MNAVPESRIIEPKILYFGTPVVLLTTENLDGTANITPMSSAWALGDRIVLGLGKGGQGISNLRERPECVLNLPGPDLWRSVEALAPLTGADPIPEWKQPLFRYEKDKFAVAGLTPEASTRVRPPRITECPIQIEAAIRHISMAGDSTSFAVVEAQALTVHAHTAIVLDDSHIAPEAWSPLIYNFRHYFGLGPDLGRTFRAEI